MYWRRQDLKFHKVHAHDTKKKTKIESSKSNASSTSSVSNLESSIGSVSSSSDDDVDFPKKNVDGGE